MAKLFNIMMDAVVREWLCILREELDMEGEELDPTMETLFTIFFLDDVYIATQDPIFLQQAINILLTTFKCIGLETNTKKTRAMTCTPGKIWLQLLSDSYQQMCSGPTPAADWDTRTVTYRECGKDMRASSLGRHLQINTRSTSSRWWPKSYLRGRRV